MKTLRHWKVENLLEASIKVESGKWYNILIFFIDVTLLLGERGFAFHGSSQRISDSNNGNFFVLIEFLFHSDAIPKEHVLYICYI